MSDALVGRYRRAYVRLWDDPKFRKLTPTAQRVCLYLLLGPQSNRIGLFKFSIPKAADDLDLGIETTRKAVATVIAAFGWQADPETRLIYLPNWWRWNTSVNTNILLGNLKDLSEIPAGALVEAFAENMAYIPPKLHESFRKALGERLPQRSPNIRQPQDQELVTGAGTGAGVRTALTRGEQASGKLSAGAGAKRRRGHGGNGSGDWERFEAFWKVYPKKVGKDDAWKAWQKKKPSADLTEQIVAALAWQRMQDDWLKEGGQYVPSPAKWINGRRWQDEPSTTPHLSKRTIAIGRGVEEFLK